MPLRLVDWSRITDEGHLWRFPTTGFCEDRLRGEEIPVYLSKSAMLLQAWRKTETCSSFDYITRAVDTDGRSTNNMLTLARATDFGPTLSQRITIIEGPPGTGKTGVVSKIVIHNVDVGLLANSARVQRDYVSEAMRCQEATERRSQLL